MIFEKDGEPLIFYITRCPLRKQAREFIEANGGKVFESSKDVYMKLVDPANPIADPDTYSVEYIFDCIRNQTLLEKEQYRMVSAGKVLGKKSVTRSEFTTEDDDLLRYLIERTDKPTSRHIYDKLALKYPQHTASSWKGRVKRKILPEMTAKGLVGTRVTEGLSFLQSPNKRSLNESQQGDYESDDEGATPTQMRQPGNLKTSKKVRFNKSQESTPEAFPDLDDLIILKDLKGKAVVEIQRLSSYPESEDENDLVAESWSSPVINAENVKVEDSQPFELDNSFDHYDPEDNAETEQSQEIFSQLELRSNVIDPMAGFMTSKITSGIASGITKSIRAMYNAVSPSTSKSQGQKSEQLNRLQSTSNSLSNKKSESENTGAVPGAAKQLNISSDSFEDTYAQSFERFIEKYEGKFIPALERKIGYSEIARANYMCSGNLQVARKLLHAGFDRRKLALKDEVQVFLKKEDEYILKGYDEWLAKLTLVKGFKAIRNREHFLIEFQKY